MVCPSPPQVGQVLAVCIVPRIVCVILVTCPVPRQVGQVFLAEPSLAPLPLQGLQVTYLFTLIFFSTPLAISSNVILTLTRRFEPRLTLLPPLLLPPPKCPPKISPNWLNI